MMSDPGVAFRFSYDGTRQSMRVAFWFLSFLGCAVAVVAAFLAAGGAPWTSILGACGVAAFFLALGGMCRILSGKRLSLPVSGHFDEFRKAFVLTETDGTMCEIPYADIESFGVRRRFSGSGKSRRIHWIVHFKKRDGAFWDLESFRKESDAAALRERLVGGVNHTQPGRSADFAPDLPDSISRETSGDKVSFTWQDRVDPVYSFLSAVALAGSGRSFWLSYGLRKTRIRWRSSSSVWPRFFSRGSRGK